MNATVDAILACRVQGGRLYGKPLQRLSPNGITIIESLIAYLKSIKSIKNIILAIAEGEENYGFIRLANELGLPYLVGSENDVLDRMIRAAEANDVTHIFRITTEGPYVVSEHADRLISEFLLGDYDWAGYKDIPEGTGYELIKTSALKRSHAEGTSRNRSELVTSFICENQNKFRLLFKELPVKLRRPEVRLTVDYAEDLVFCQQVFKELKKDNSLIPVEDIIDFWDDNPEIRKPIESIGIEWGTGRLAWTESDRAHSAASNLHDSADSK